MNDELFQRRLARETHARKQAEALLEEKSLALYLEAQERQAILDALRASEQKLAYQASHDLLTDVFNRGALYERIDEAISSAQRHQYPIWVCFLDMDRFKYINDRYGHAVGDQLLVTITARLHQALRKDDVIGRYGGDEFILMLRGDPHHELTPQTIQRILHTVCEPINIDQHPLQVTCSLGIAAFPIDGDTPAQLIERADAAMYIAKQSGRNMYQFYNAEIHSRVQERALIESCLTDALERNEFVLHYQPQVELLHGRLIGVETLLRWNHPELGLLSPDRFIPFAEESRLINQIGAWVLSEACKQCAAWHKAGFEHLRVAVNLSARQINGLELTKLVDMALADSGLAPAFLELELTETLMMSNLELTLETLHGLHERGVQVAIDDFGTGYSSFAYLKRLPLSSLKIDRQFVSDLDGDATVNSATIAHALIQLAHNLGLRVIAEGVETEQQLHLLRTLGCDEIQGWLHSRAVAADELEQILSTHNDSEWCRDQSPPIELLRAQ